MINGLIIATVTALIGYMFWAARHGKPSAVTENNQLVFRHSKLLLGLFLFLAVAFPTVMTAISIIKPLKNAWWEVVGFGLLFPVLFSPIIWELFRFSLVVSAKGLDCRSPWRGRRFLMWDEVGEVAFSAMNGWFIIVAKDGWRFRVYFFVPGLSRLLEECEIHLKESALAQAGKGYWYVGRELPGHAGTRPAAPLDSSR